MSDQNPYAASTNPYNSPGTVIGQMNAPKRKRLTRIAPLQAGIVLGVLYAAIALIAVPFVLLATFAAPSGSAGIGIGFAIMIPIIYGVAGFIGGVICAAVYNLVAGWTGGLAFETVES